MKIQIEFEIRKVQRRFKIGRVEIWVDFGNEKILVKFKIQIEIDFGRFWNIGLELVWMIWNGFVDWKMLGGDLRVAIGLKLVKIKNLDGVRKIKFVERGVVLDIDQEMSSPQEEWKPAN